VRHRVPSHFNGNPPRSQRFISVCLPPVSCIFNFCITLVLLCVIILLLNASLILKVISFFCLLKICSPYNYIYIYICIILHIYICVSYYIYMCVCVSYYRMERGAVKRNRNLKKYSLRHFLPRTAKLQSEIQRINCRFIHINWRYLPPYTDYKIYILYISKSSGATAIQGLGRQSGRRRSAKLVPTFADRGVSRGKRNGSPRPLISVYRTWIATYFIQVAPQLTSWGSRGWVYPVPDPLPLRKSGSAGNITRDLRICTHKLWPLDHRGGLYYIYNNKIGRRGQACRNPLLILTSCVNVVSTSTFISFFPFCFVTTKQPRYYILNEGITMCL